MPTDDRDTIKMTTEIATAFLSRSATTTSEIPALIQSVHATLLGLADKKRRPKLALGSKPAVPITESITPDCLVCLEDGKEFKSLKFHLRSHGLSPSGYRAKWALPLDYPMVAPNLSAGRSARAKAKLFGQSRKLKRETVSPQWMRGKI